MQRHLLCLRNKLEFENYKTDDIANSCKSCTSEKNTFTSGDELSHHGSIVGQGVGLIHVSFSFGHLPCC